MQLVLEKRAERSTAIAIASPLIAVTLTLVTVGILFAIMGKNPIAALIVYAAYRAVQFAKYKKYRIMPRIQVEELVARLASDEACRVQIVDVRSHGYYDVGSERIKNSIRIEPNNLDEEVKNLSKDKDIYLYCT